MLSALVGNGAQLATLVLLVIILAIVGMLYVGYVCSRLYWPNHLTWEQSLVVFIATHYNIYDIAMLMHVILLFACSFTFSFFAIHRVEMFLTFFKIPLLWLFHITSKYNLITYVSGEELLSQHSLFVMLWHHLFRGMWAVACTLVMVVCITSTDNLFKLLSLVVSTLCPLPEFACPITV